jgi:hypothetical protein
MSESARPGYGAGTCRALLEMAHPPGPICMRDRATNARGASTRSARSRAATAWEDASGGHRADRYSAPILMTLVSFPRSSISHNWPLLVSRM